MKKEVPEKEVTQPKLIEGVDFYFENGLMVLTEEFLRERGYCCGNGCRHCPYLEKQDADSGANNAEARTK